MSILILCVRKFERHGEHHAAMGENQTEESAELRLNSTARAESAGSECQIPYIGGPGTTRRFGTTPPLIPMSNRMGRWMPLSKPQRPKKRSSSQDTSLSLAHRKTDAARLPLWMPMRSTSNLSGQPTADDRINGRYTGERNPRAEETLTRLRKSY
jgi:hypothetical protein